MPPISSRNSLAERPIALSCGDPAGIGAEITRKAWHALRESAAIFFVIGDPRAFDDSAKISAPSEAAAHFRDKLPVLPLAPQKSAAHSAWASLDAALDRVIAHEASALVSNPVNKARLAEIGFQEAGQTEYLARRCGARRCGAVARGARRGSAVARGTVARSAQALMMLAAGNMRCALVTTHLPLRDVPASLSAEKIIDAGRILLRALKEDFGIAAPRIGVAALNPHAGEGGMLGDEEARVIAPACAALGANFSAPLAADTLFKRKGFDAFLCMFHDQALIPVKLQAGAAVNITLGLPIIRTSPDHGTAFDIVGKNIADPSSLIAAITSAHQLAQTRYAQR